MTGPAVRRATSVHAVLPLLLLFLLFLLFPLCPGAAGQDAIARARQLYVAAAYEEALAVLDGAAGETTGAEAVPAAEYRALCLLALDRQDEARRAIEALVALDPLHRLPEGQVSPRVQAIFDDIRRQALPRVIERAYADARAAFDRKDPDAGAAFDRVLALLDDPDGRAMPAAADLRTIAAGFRDLIRAAAAAAEAAEAAAADAARRAAAAGENPSAQTASSAEAATPASSNPVPAADAAAAAAAPDVTPPVAISQALPPWSPTPAERRQSFKGALELLIDEEGRVASAAIQVSINPRYDQELLKAARTWRYKPATRGGAPVAYVKVVEIQLRPQ